MALALAERRMLWHRPLYFIYLCVCHSIAPKFREAILKILYLLERQYFFPKGSKWAKFLGRTFFLYMNRIQLDDTAVTRRAVMRWSMFRRAVQWHDFVTCVRRARAGGANARWVRLVCMKPKGWSHNLFIFMIDRESTVKFNFVYTFKPYVTFLKDT